MCGSSSEESGVVCLKVECAVGDITCLTNLTKSVQWQHVSLPSISSVSDGPITVVDVQTAGPAAGQPTIADLYPTSFDIIAGNDQQLFDVVNTTPSDDDGVDSRRRRPAESAAAAAAGKRGKCHAVTYRQGVHRAPDAAGCTPR